MSSVVRVKCWICPESFHTNRELKNHAASSIHSALRVICRWCFELLKHVEKRHEYVTEETKKGEIFSENNGYWLAIEPKDYIKLIKPTDYLSTSALQTRAIVGRWLDKVKGKTSRGRDQWKEGWELTKAKEVTIYSPSKPTLPEAKLRLQNLQFSPMGQTAYLLDEEATIGDVWYKVEIRSDVFSDKKGADNLLRRLQTLKPGKTVPTDFSTLVRDREGLTRAAARALGITEKFITRMYRQIVSFSTSRKRKLGCLAEELGISDDVEITEPVATSGRKTPTSGKAGEKATTVRMESPDRVPIMEEDTPRSVDTPPSDIKKSLSPPPKASPVIDETITDTVLNVETEELSTPKPPMKTMVERAGSLLRTGVMPLLPPARREWANTNPIQLTDKNTVLTWPPLNWNGMSEDEKLTAWTYTSMALEFNRGVTVIKDLADLVDRYAILALPGTAVGKTDLNRAVGLRLKNFHMLKDIYHGTLQEEDALPWIEVLEAARTGAHRTTQSTEILKKIEHLPLRLKLEQETE